MPPHSHAAFSLPAPLPTQPPSLPPIPSRPRIRVNALIRTAQLSRRSIIALVPLVCLPLLPSETHTQTLTTPPPADYDANKSRRYIPIGRPAPERAPPTFAGTPFAIDGNLQGEDVRVGTGAVVESGSLVVAKWVMLLDDGTIVDDSNENLAAFFRPGAHQVVPGVEDGVVGMREGGRRRIKGSAERVLTSVRMGYDIGERSLVPSGAVVFLDIQVDRVNPYGR